MCFICLYLLLFSEFNMCHLERRSRNALIITIIIIIIIIVWYLFRSLFYYLIFARYGELSVLEYFLFFKAAPRCSDPGIDFFFCSVFAVCGLSEVIMSLFQFFPDQLVYLHYLHGLSCILSFPCVFVGKLSDFQ